MILMTYEIPLRVRFVRLLDVLERKCHGAEVQSGKEWNRCVQTVRSHYTVIHWSFQHGESSVMPGRNCSGGRKTQSCIVACAATSGETSLPLFQLDRLALSEASVSFPGIFHDRQSMLGVWYFVQDSVEEK